MVFLVLWQEVSPAKPRAIVLARIGRVVSAYARHVDLLTPVLVLVCQGQNHM